MKFPSSNFKRTTQETTHVASVVEEERRIDEKQGEESVPPDGGYGWVITFGAMLAMFSTWGSNASYGIFLDYYITSNAFPGTSQTEYVLIGGLVMFLGTGLAPLSTSAYKVLGAKWLILIGVVLQTVGYVLASFATKLWQLYLTQGVLVGVSFLLIYIPATLALPTWFSKKKATSMGLCISGSGLGGLIFSLSINRVIEQTGDQRWALRMVAFVALFAALVALIVLKPFNYKPKPLLETVTKEFMLKSLRESCNLSLLFKRYELGILATWFAVVQVAYFILLFTLASYALSIGLTAQQGLNLTSIINAAQMFGRPMLGIVADRFGRFNAMIGFSIILTTLLFAFWINAQSYGTLIAFSVLCGLFVGIGPTITLPIASDILGPDMQHELDVVWGGLNVFIALFLLVAGVIALSLTQSQSSRPYLHAQIFTGCCFAYCVVSGLCVREWVVRRSVSERLDELLKSQELLSDEESGDLQMQQVKLEQLSESNVRRFIQRSFYVMKI